MASMNRIDSESSFKEFQRLEDRIAEMEVRVNACGGSGFAGDHSQFSKLEYADEVEKEIEKMRQAKNPAPGTQKAAGDKQAN